MNRHHVVHVTTTDISLALLLGPQLRAFADAGYRVTGVSAPGPFVEELRAWGIDHLPLRHATRAADPRRDLAALAELVRLFRRVRPDLVHTHNPKPGVWGRVAARIAGVPAVVNTVHGLYAQPHDRLAKRAAVYSIERVAAAFSHAELVQNGEDLAVLRRLGVGSAKLRLLGNGIDLCRFDPARAAPAAVAATRAELGVAPSDVLCLAVGRLVAEKGYRELCAAAERLRNPFPNLRVVIAGPDEPAKRDAITDRERAHWAGIAGVHFLGHRADVFELYAASDIYVLASHREGFPRSAMEAAAMGLPIVATDIRGCRQVVEHGRTGLTVPVGEVGALARALATLAADPDRRQAMGGLARVKAEREFDQRRVIDLTLETYARLLRGRPRQDAGAAMNHPAPVTTP